MLSRRLVGGKACRVILESSSINRERFFIYWTDKKCGKNKQTYESAISVQRGSAKDLKL